MNRSFLAGSVSGLALSVVTLSAMSLMAPPVAMRSPAPELAQAETPAAPAETPAAAGSVAPAPEAAKDTAPDLAADTAAATDKATDMAAGSAAGSGDLATPGATPAGSEFNKPATDAAAAVPAADAAGATAAPAPATPPAPSEGQTPAAADMTTAPAPATAAAPAALPATPAEPAQPAPASATATAEQSAPQPAVAPAQPALQPPSPDSVASAPLPDSAPGTAPAAGAGPDDSAVPMIVFDDGPAPDAQPSGAPVDPYAPPAPAPDQSQAAQPATAPATTTATAPETTAPAADGTVLQNKPRILAPPGSETPVPAVDAQAPDASGNPPATPAPDGTTPDGSAPAAPAADGSATAPDATTPDGTGDESLPSDEMNNPDSGGPGPDATTPDGTAPDGTAPDGSQDAPKQQNTGIGTGIPGAPAPLPDRPKMIRVTPRASSGGENSSSGESLGTIAIPADSGSVKVAVAPMPGTPAIRLPGTADDATVAPAAPGEAAAALPPDGGSPLSLYAAKFTNPDNKPVIAVVILDQGVAAGGLDPEALATLPSPVTIAVDPLRKDAAADAAIYRAAGNEVAILADDPPAGATASDEEVAYQSYSHTLPESVALIPRPGTELTRDSRKAQHIASLLKADGRGLITYEQGLNPGSRAAERIGLSHASVEKLFGTREDNNGSLSRELDRVAFQAGQRHLAVIALPSTPEAITSFIAWLGSSAASSVVVAPVSAVMPNTMAN